MPCMMLIRNLEPATKKSTSTIIRDYVLILLTETHLLQRAICQTDGGCLAIPF